MTDLDLLEQRLRVTFEQVAELPVGALSGGQATGRRRRSERSLRRAAVGLAAAVAIGVTLSFVLTSGTVGGPVLKLASYSFRLPRAFTEGSASSAQCWTVLAGPATVGGSGVGTSVESAVSADGGCVIMELSAPYTPTPADPDPVAYLTGLQPTTVAGYRSYIGVESEIPSASVPPGYVGIVQTVAGQVRASAEGRGSSSVPTRPSTQLYVELPLANGRQEDLAIGANGLSDAQLIAIVANGLSGSSSAG